MSAAAALCAGCWRQRGDRDVWEHQEPCACACHDDLVMIRRSALAELQSYRDGYNAIQRDVARALLEDPCDACERARRSRGGDPLCRRCLGIHVALQTIG